MDAEDEPTPEELEAATRFARLLDGEDVPDATQEERELAAYGELAAVCGAPMKVPPLGATPSPMPAPRRWLAACAALLVGVGGFQLLRPTPPALAPLPPRPEGPSREVWRGRAGRLLERARQRHRFTRTDHSRALTRRVARRQRRKAWELYADRKS